MKLSQTRIAIALAILVVTTSGCGLVNRIRAKNELNEAARAYREGNFTEAEQYSRRALELDPDSKTAPVVHCPDDSRAISSRCSNSGKHSQSERSNSGLPADSGKKILRTTRRTKQSPISWAHQGRRQTEGLDFRARQRCQPGTRKTRRGLRGARQ